MDLIRELKDVRFVMNLRGYDCDAVDAFLAKIRGEIAELQSQRERAQERVATLESQLADGESDTEGTLRRTLVLAQRLADETVADAKQTAESMVETAASDAARTRESAQTESDALLARANDEAVAAREEARQELDRAREDAARTSEEVAVETARMRADAANEVERMLAEAEEAGAARVAALESTAKEEIAASREPIREEIVQLEATRASLLSDIEALEEHLAEQRTRVRTAVEALRAGMSGSIDDLERVAADDTAMSTAPQPSLSGAAASDVDVAPDVDVAESVRSHATPAPTVEELADRAAAESSEAEDHDDGGDPVSEDVTSSDSVETDDDEDEDEWSPIPDDLPSDVDGISEAVVIDDPDPATEPIPVVVVDADADPNEPDETDEESSEVVDLDAAPSALFGTDVAGGSNVVDAESSAMDAEIVDVDQHDDSEAGDHEADGASFLSRFGEAIGDLPIAGRS